MNYYVSFFVSGVLTIPVNLNEEDADKAKRIAQEEFNSYNFGELFGVEGEIIRIESNNGIINK